MTDLKYTREQLIGLCEKAIRPEKVWSDRDSEMAQRQIGEAWVLLKAGCRFSIDESDTSESTIWIHVVSEGFDYFESEEYSNRFYYIPSEARLEQVGEKDWYC